MSDTPPPNMSTAISATQHGPLVTIATSLSLIGMFLFLLIRLAIRWPWKQLLGADDFCTIGASILGLGQSIATLQAVSHGLGTHQESVSLAMVDRIRSTILAGDILFVLAMAASRLSVSVLLLRLSSSKRLIQFAKIFTVVMAVWAVAATVAVGVCSHIADIWTDGSSHRNQLSNVWIGVGVSGVLLEVVLLVFPAFLLWSLQMPVGSKWTVAIGFLCRVPVSITTILRIISIHSVVTNDSDMTWAYVTPGIYTEVELHYSIIAATIPCMHIFLRNFSTGYLGTTADQVDPTGSATQGSSSYELSKLRERQKDSQTKSKSREETKTPTLRLRPDYGQNVSRIEHPDEVTENGSITSDGSDRIIIRNTVMLDWEPAR